MKTPDTVEGLRRLGIELQFTDAHSDGLHNWFLYYLWLGRAKFEFQAPGMATAAQPLVGEVQIARLGHELDPACGWAAIKEELESELGEDPLAAAVRASLICEVLLHTAELARISVPAEYEWREAALRFRHELDTSLNRYFKERGELAHDPGRGA